MTQEKLRNQEEEKLLWNWYVRDPVDWMEFSQEEGHMDSPVETRNFLYLHPFAGVIWHTPNTNKPARCDLKGNQAI